MDTDPIYQHARARFEHAAARRALKEKYQARMMFAYGGGMWHAGPDLLTVLAVCPDSTAVLLDLYDTPVKIEVAQLRELAQQRWQEQMTAWQIEHQDLSRQR